VLPIDYDALASILTLRYNPRRRPLRKPLGAADFAPAKTDNPEARILSIIQDELERLKGRSVSVLLSGGVDSVLTLAMLKRFRPDVRVSCVSMGFGDGDDETAAAEKIATAHGCDFVQVVKDDILSDLPLLVSIAREPRWNLYQYYAFAACKEKTIFSGDGGDELFAGYTFRYQKYLSLLPKRSGWKRRAMLYLSCHERDWVPDQQKVFGPKVKFSWNRICRLLRRHFDNSLAPLDQVFLADYDGKLLYDWMPANAALVGALGSKVVSLFLSDRMTKFATHLTWQQKYDVASATGKLPLRAILRKEGLGTKPVKKGFSVNTVSLWKRSGQELASRYVGGESEAVRAGVISSEWVQKTMARLAAEPDVRYVNKMLGILALEVWWRLFVSRTLKSKQRL
jgi:asparagine synthase (glutamine-hydrolysing)